MSHILFCFLFHEPCVHWMRRHVWAYQVSDSHEFKSCTEAGSFTAKGNLYLSIYPFVTVSNGWPAPKLKIGLAWYYISLQRSIYMRDLFWVVVEEKPKYDYHLFWRLIYRNGSLLGLVVGDDKKNRYWTLYLWCYPNVKYVLYFGWYCWR
jgi:hypothetical protein